jgi:hypothetical protein
MRINFALPLVVAGVIASPLAGAGPAKGTIQCNEVKHEVKSAVAFYVPEKKHFQIMLYNTALSDADQKTAAIIDGARVLGRRPKGAGESTAAEQKLRADLAPQQAMLIRGEVKKGGDKVDIADLDRVLLFSVNCGPNNSMNYSTRLGEKDAADDAKKQFSSFAFPTKDGAVAKFATGKQDRVPNPKFPSMKTKANWSVQGEAKVAVFE